MHITQVISELNVLALEIAMKKNQVMSYELFIAEYEGYYVVIRDILNAHYLTVPFL